MPFSEDNNIDWVTEPKDVEQFESFQNNAKEEFTMQLASRVSKMARQLITRKVEPGNHPFYPKKRQEETYFKHKGQGGIVDVRTINSDYAKNLYNWYIKHHDYDENILFMKTLRSKFEE